MQTTNDFIESNSLQMLQALLGKGKGGLRLLVETETMSIHVLNYIIRLLTIIQKTKIII